MDECLCICIIEIILAILLIIFLGRMIMKCHRRFSECCQRCSQRNSSDVILGGLSKLKSKQVIKNELYKIFGNTRIRNILTDIFFNNRKETCEKIIEAMIIDNNKLPFSNVNELYVRIVYRFVIKDVQENLKHDETIDKTKLMTILKNVYPNIQEELSKEQQCIMNNMESFKSLFPKIDFDKESEEFRNMSLGDVENALTKYCELEFVLEDPQIITDQLDLKWFARNLIGNLQKKQSEKSEDDLHNEDDDDALLAYYVNELKGK